MNKEHFAALYTLRPDGRYQGYYRDLDGRRHPVCDRDPAKLHKKIQAKIDALAHPVITLRMAADSWEGRHREEIGAKTWNNYRPHVQEILAAYGKRPVAEISALEVQQDVNRAKARGFGRTVVQTRRSIWRMIFDHAIISGWRLDNPCAAVKLPKGLPRGKRAAPTDAEIRTVMSSADAPLGLFAILLLCTGLRKAEALALTWDDVDLAAGEIRVTKALDYPTGAKPSVKAPKTAAGIRTVPILDVLRPHLEAAQAAASSPILFPALPSNRGGPGGGFMTLRGYDDLWKKYQAATGLQLTAHQLRHGTATLMFEAGVDELTAQRILGHSRVEITREIYTDLREKKQRQSVALLNAKLSYLIAKPESD